MSILAYRPLHFHAPGKFFFIVPLQLIRRRQSKFPHYGSRSHFHPGPPSNVNTVLYNGAAPIMYNGATRRLQGGCGRVRDRERESEQARERER